jgi:hypothetical protein
MVDAVRDGEVGLALPLTAEKGKSVILKHPDTRTMATG